MGVGGRKRERNEDHMLADGVKRATHQNRLVCFRWSQTVFTIWVIVRGTKPNLWGVLCRRGILVSETKGTIQTKMKVARLDEPGRALPIGPEITVVVVESISDVSSAFHKLWQAKKNSAGC